MKDSTLDQRWLAEMIQRNPPSKTANGNITTGPVRLAFPNIFKPSDRKNDNGEPSGKYGATILFPFGVNLSLFDQEWNRVARQEFPKNWDANGRPVGLHSPFHDQIDKTVGVKTYAGFTPGAVYVNISSNYKPQVVDANMNPIVDESRVYGGVWAIVSVNVYSYFPKKGQAGKTGVGFGLQSVVIIADDQKLGGQGSDPRQDFAGISITATSDIASRMGGLTGTPVGGAAPSSIMPAGGYVGQAGVLPVQGLPAPVSVEDLY
jgi:hypothetical protein